MYNKGLTPGPLPEVDEMLRPPGPVNSNFVPVSADEFGERNFLYNGTVTLEGIQLPPM